MKELLRLSKEDMAALMTELSQPAYRARQLYARVMRGCSIEEMTELPKGLRERLAAEYTAGLPETVTVKSAQDGTKKYLFRLYDGATIESVLLRYDYGNTVCASTQAGCAMGCAFCASCKNGLLRNLLPHEIYAQVAAIERDAHISHVVLMGSGEPLANYGNVIKFLAMMREPEGLNIGIRNISLSTCGLAPEMRRLADSGYTPTLALSLHAPDDETRRKIMPVARRYSVEETLAAAKYYFAKTGRRIIVEYTLIAGVNDAAAQAKTLAARLSGLCCHVNLIAMNGEVGGLCAPDEGTLRAFLFELTAAGQSATLRRSLGGGIEGACGQLKAGYEVER